MKFHESNKIRIGKVEVLILGTSFHVALLLRLPNIAICIVASNRRLITHVYFKNSILLPNLNIPETPPEIAKILENTSFFFSGSR